MQTHATSTTHIEKRLSGKTFAQGFWDGFRHVFVTVAFIALAIFAIMAAWYVSAWFQNESYKAVVFFLDIITVSNVTGKYATWTMKL